MMKSVSFSLLLASIIAIIITTSSITFIEASSNSNNNNINKYNNPFVGVWHSDYPSVTPIGPGMTSSGGLTSTIYTDPNTNQWVIEHDLMDNSIKYSAQRFLVNNPHIGNDTLVYCGWLVNFYSSMNENGGQVMVVMKKERETDKEIVWTSNQITGYPLRWKLELIDSDTLTSTVTFPAPYINHFVATFKRQKNSSSSSTFDNLSEKSKELMKNNLPPPCNTLTTIPHHDSSSSTTTKSNNNNNIDNNVPHSKCPFGFLKGKIPEFVKNMMSSNKKKNIVDEDVVNKNENQKKEEDPKKEEQQQQKQKQKEKEHLKLFHSTIPESHLTNRYQYCVKLNAALNFTIRYTMNHQTKAADVMISATPRAQSAEQTWIGIGIMSYWPTMEKQDIILGYLSSASGAGCVRSMYGKQAAGTPVSNTKQVLKIGRVFLNGENDSVLNVQFSRPWKTGNWDLEKGPFFPPNASVPVAFPTLSFATGKIPTGATCDSTPGYHFGDRGVHGWSWPEPKTAIPPELFC